MRTGGRVGARWGIVCTLLVVAAIGLARGGQDETAAPTLAEELTRYLELLARVRSGDDDAVEDLLRHANHLCGAWDRCDAKAVARHYVSLSPARPRRAS